MTDVLGVEMVDVSMANRKILSSVTFSICAGELIGLIGSNGAGKTTLFRVILGLQRSDAGRVTLPSARGRRAVGYVPQRSTLSADLPLRARDLVALGLDGDRFGIPLGRRRARMAAADEMLERLDVSSLAKARVGELSGGEQQRVLIAHALVGRPQLLLLDEPLANLDLASTYEVVSLLSRVTAEQGVAVFLSAHEMNPLLGVMDRIAYIAGGKVAIGTTQEVVRGDVLSALYGHHVDVLRVHGRILVVAGPESGDEELLASSAALAAP
ncbi:MAG: metal ABC transporter ATP-binding protein [Acidimicrobiales bacterium]